MTPTDRGLGPPNVAISLYTEANLRMELRPQFRVHLPISAD